ncbi:(deoxy)nucleoside triphosphate pyrophosphohydrolase [Halomonas sp. BL6]|uniref:(deoxy)nucleoside triphosphate pyrophosphohydrolase n=1 Tax=Halomonas sp. BL6 TaxID=2585770 RepID=UPI00111AB4E9|nr:(deoxy)nucleoside triphosphate pyrophosphohydrolase [Halomonas sp. BL6]TNH19976.1 (deoxy)nucleoside triphosphate pyrophosphohydrolase [Halomonas sp. BL6]
MKNVAAALAIANGQIMLTRRAPGQQLEGFWEFPGGKVEPGETVYQCIEREIKEELNLTCVAERIFQESVYEYPGGAINLIGVLVTVTGEPVLHVHDSLTWAPLTDLLNYKLAPADIPIAKELISTYGLD